MTKTALIDCDGVLADFTSHVCAGTSLKPSEVTNWDLFSLMPAVEAYTARQRCSEPRFWSTMRTYPDAIRLLTTLRELEYRVHIITSPWSWETAGARVEWLSRHFPGLYDEVILTRSKHNYPGDLFIDDNTDNVLNWRAANPGKLGIIFSQPYNKDAIDIPRLGSYLPEDLYRIIATHRICNLSQEDDMNV